MPRTISEIYDEYEVGLGTREHMLRVAAVASMICDNFDESLPKDEIITACLLHDMGNIIKSDLNYFPEFIQPQGLDYWQSVKDKYIEKYGDDEHEATIKIMRELNVSQEIIKLVNQVDFSFLCKNFSGNDFRIKIVNYADMRVDPHGVVSYEERQEEARKRYKNRPELYIIQNRDELTACGKGIEKQIFAKCKIKPEDINNATVAPLITDLKNFVIK